MDHELKLKHKAIKSLKRTEENMFLDLTPKILSIKETYKLYTSNLKKNHCPELKLNSK